MMSVDGGCTPTASPANVRELTDALKSALRQNRFAEMPETEYGRRTCFRTQEVCKKTPHNRKQLLKSHRKEAAQALHAGLFSEVKQALAHYGLAAEEERNLRYHVALWKKGTYGEV